MASEGTELGVEWISILPSMKDFAKQVTKGVSSAAKTGAKSFSDQFNRNIKDSVTKGASQAGKDAGAAMARAALAAAKSDVAKLSKTLAAATDKQADSLGKLRVAESRLTDTRQKAAQATAKVKKAEEDLARLMQAEVGDAKAIEAASKALAQARQSESSASTRLAAAEESAASAKRKSSAATASATAASEKLTKAQQKEKEAADAVGKAQEDVGKKASLGARLGGKFSESFKKGFKPAGGIEDELGKVDGRREGKSLAARFGVGFNGAFGGVVSKSAALLAATFATVGIGSLVKDSVGLEATFSQTMNTMAAVAKVPAAEIKSLSDLAVKLGADTTFSANEAATAMLELAKGGLNAATIESGALAGTLTLAAAGGTDLETAATIASNALNTFSLKGSDMAAVAAAMAGGANASSASVESLGEALSQVGPGASTAGLSIQETVAVLSAFDAAGIKGSDAGTSLKTMLTRLVPSTEAAAGAMEDLGLKFTDAQGNFLPITNIAQQLQTKLSGLSDEQRTLALSTIFGSDATRAATVLMKEGASGVQQFITATSDMNAANEVAASRMSGTAGAVEAFKGSVETVLLQIGQFIAPAVQAGLKAVTDGLNNIIPAFKGIAALIGSGDFTKNFREAFNVEEDSPVVAFLLNLRQTVIDVFNEIKARVTPSIQAIGEGFQNLVPFVVSFATNLKTDLLPPVTAVAKLLVGLALLLVQSVGPAFEAVTGFIKEHATLVQAVAVGVGAAVLAFKAYQGAMLVANAAGKAFAAVQAAINFVMALNPITVVVLAIIALVAALIYAYKHSEKFRNIVNGVFNGVKSVVLTVVNALVTAFHAVVSAFKTVGSAIGTAINAIVTAFNAVKNAVSAAVSFVAKVWNGIINAVMVPVNAVIAVLQAVWSRIYPIIVLPFYIANTAIDKAWALVKAGFNAAVGFVTGVFSAAWNKISDVLSGPINTAKNWIAQRWADIQAGFTAAKNWVTGTFSKAWSAVKDTISVPVNNAKTNLDTAWTKIKSAFTTTKDWAVGAFAKAWAAVKGKITGPIDAAKTAIATALGKGKNGLQWVFSQAVSAIGTIWDALKETAKAPVRFVISTVLNNGLIDGFNWIAGKFNAPTIAHIPLPKGFAQGGQFSGRLPGPPSAVDNMLGMTAAGPVGLATGEFITNAKDTARALPLLQHINNGGELPGFADGGLFGKLKSVISTGFNNAKDFGSDAVGFLKDPVKWFKDRFSGPLGRLDELGNSTLAQTVKAAPRKAATSIVDGAKSLLGLGGGGFNASLAGVLDFVRGQVGKPYLWGGVGPGGYDCSGLVSAAINVALGRNPYSRLGSTGSMPWGMFDPGPGSFSIGWFKGNPGHTAATVNGTNIESRGGRGVLMGAAARGAKDGLFTNIAHLRGFASGGLLTNRWMKFKKPSAHELHMAHLAHKAHVAHLAHVGQWLGRVPGDDRWVRAAAHLKGDAPFDILSRRGRAFKPQSLLFDNGGYLPTGVSTVVNNTGKPEPLVRADEDMTVRLSREDRELLRALRDIPVLLDSRRIDEGMTRLAMNGGF